MNFTRMQAEVDATLAEQGVPPVVHPPPFYGDPADVPERPPIIAGVQFRVPSTALGDLKPFVGGNARSGPSAMDALCSKMARMGHRPAGRGERADQPECLSRSSERLLLEQLLMIHVKC